MGSGIFNIVIGLVMVGGALTQGWTLIGTNSPHALAGVGGVIAALGIYQIVKAKRS